MEAKRGQITLFMIIGIIILIALCAVFYIKNMGSGSNNYRSNVNFDASSVKNFVASCVKNTAQDAVIYTGLRGGDIFSTDYAELLGIKAPYYFSGGSAHLVSDDTIKQSLKYYMDNTLKSCTHGFQSFTDQGYTVTEGEMSSTVNLYEKEVVFDVAYPVTVASGKMEDHLANFSANVRVNLKKMAATSRQYVTDYQSVMPDSFRLKSLMDLCQDKGFKFEVFEKGGNTVIISIVDDSVKIKGNPYVFVFAVRYNWPAIT